MDYFVSIENNNYCYWQTELLIQSFKRIGMQENLLIGIAQNDEPKYPYFSTNLGLHNRKFLHENIGAKHDCLSLNRPFAIVSALASGMLKQPFALVHADMVLTAPISNELSKGTIGFDQETPDPLVMKNIDPYLKPILQVKGISEGSIQPLPVGAVLVFNDIPSFFFNRVYQRSMQLIQETGTDWDVEKGAWMLTFYEHLGLFNFTVTQYSGGMIRGDINGNFVHYKHGNTPYFNKIHFKYNAEAFMTLNATDPYQTILEQPPHPPTQYLQEIVKERNRDQDELWTKLWADQLETNIKTAEEDGTQSEDQILIARAVEENVKKNVKKNATPKTECDTGCTSCTGCKTK